MDGHWAPVVEPIVAALDPSVLVRVGPASDPCVRGLISDAAHRGAVLHLIDPLAAADTVNRVPNAETAVVVHREKCLNALARFTGADLVLLEGDHNWYTVKSALQILERQAKAAGHGFPVVILSAVDWPYGRRDAYPDPEGVPDAYRHHFRRAGLLPGQSEPVDEGGLGADVAHAIYERGARNGVRTAVEDFMAESGLALAFVEVPGLHGLCVLYTEDHHGGNRELRRALKHLRSKKFLRGQCKRIEELRLQEALAAAGLREESGKRAEAVAAGQKQSAAQGEQLQAHVAQIEAMRLELARLSAKSGDRARAHDKAKDEHAAAEQRASALERRLESREGELDALRAECSRSEAALKERERAEEDQGKKRLAMERELSARADALARLEAESRGMRQELERLEAALKAQKEGGAEEKRERVEAEERASAARREEGLVRAELEEQTRLEQEARRELSVEQRQGAGRERELASRATELEAARRRIQRLEAQLSSGERELEVRNEELDAARSEAKRLEIQLTSLGAELQTAAGERERAERELEGRRAELAERARIETGLVAEIRRHHQVISQLTLALDEVRDDIQRVAGSRAWRWGHAVTRALRLLTFRKPITEGAVAAALRRIERVEEQQRALSAAVEPAVAVEPAAVEPAVAVEPGAPERGPRALEAPLSFCIKMGAPNWEAAKTWGDVYFAEAVQRQLERRGHRCLIQVLEEWDASAGLAYDVVLHLKGTARYSTRPEQFNVLWNISHPDVLTGEECNGYDLVCVASERFALRLRPKTRAPVITIDQATDPDVFFPDSDPAYEHELVFVGNSRNVMRRILRDLLPTDRDLAVWGGQWEGLIDKKYILADRIPNGDLRKVYSSGSIVLNDHWDDMREHGFISNRVYDALACGACVISDHLPELEQRFDGAVQTYDSPADLHRLIAHYSSAPVERRELGLRGRELVLGRHTFSHRVDELVAAVRKRTRETGPTGAGTR